MKLQEAIDNLRRLDQQIQVYDWVLNERILPELPGDADENVETVELPFGDAVPIEAVEEVVDAIDRLRVAATKERDKLVNKKVITERKSKGKEKKGGE